MVIKKADLLVIGAIRNRVAQAVANAAIEDGITIRACALVNHRIDMIVECEGRKPTLYSLTIKQHKEAH